MDGWNKSYSPTYKTLKLLLWLLSVFCLYREFNVKGARFALQIVYAFINIATWLVCSGKVIWCFIGAENAMKSRNVIIYAVMLIITLLGVFYIIFGFFFLPRKLKKFLQTCDELRTDPLFQVSYVNLERRIKIFTVLCITIMTLISAMFLYTSPLIHISSRDLNCLQSPLLDTSFSWFFTVNGITYIFICVLFCGHKLTVPLFFFFMCSILKLELTRCNDEFFKCVDTVVTERKIQEIKSRYFKISKLVKEADDVLIMFTSMSLTVDIGPICAYIHGFVYVAMNPTETATYVLVCCLAVIDMTIFLLQGTSLNEKSLECLETAKLLDTTKLNQKALSSLVLFVENMKGSNIGISVMKLFILDKAAILTIFGTLISYIIVIIQFKPT